MKSHANVDSEGLNAVGGWYHVLAEKMGYPRWGNEGVVDRRQDGEQVGGRKRSHHFLSWVAGCLYELDACFFVTMHETPPDKSSSPGTMSEVPSTTPV